MAGRSRHACEPLQAAVIRVNASDRTEHLIGAIGPQMVNLHRDTIANDSHRICTASCGQKILPPAFVKIGAKMHIGSCPASALRARI